MQRHERRIECFGDTSHVAVLSADAGSAGAALDEAVGRLRRWHDHLTRFDPESELSRFNADARACVRASPELLALAAAVRPAGELSGGLVDATLLGALERAGYDRSLGPRSPAPAIGRPARAARAHPDRRWRHVQVDAAAGCVRRPPGVPIDSGGLAKGLAADDVARALAGFPRFTVDCSGDLRVGGTDPRTWRVDVADPAGGPPVAVLAVLNDHAVATSGITRRAWSARGGRRHHILDPSTGRPAYTGVVQATALAPTGWEAEVRAKTALLAGPQRGPGHLPHGGALVLAAGEVVIVDPAGPSAAAGQAA